MLTATIAATIVLASPPCNNPRWSGCYDTAHRRIELASSADAHTRHHEIAHAFDHQSMTATDRAWFTRQTSANASVTPSERFADVYATCATRGLIPRGRGRVRTGAYGAVYPLAIYRRMCRKLRYSTRGISYRANR